MTLWGVLLILLVLALIAAIPAWPYSRGWGFSPFSLVAAVCLLVVLLWALGIVELQGVEEAVNDIDQSQ